MVIFDYSHLHCKQLNGGYPVDSSTRIYPKTGRPLEWRSVYRWSEPSGERGERGGPWKESTCRRSGRERPCGPRRRQGRNQPQRLTERSPCLLQSQCARLSSLPVKCAVCLPRACPRLTITTTSKQTGAFTTTNYSRLYTADVSANVSEVIQVCCARGCASWWTVDNLEMGFTCFVLVLVVSFKCAIAAKQGICENGNCTLEANRNEHNTSVPFADGNKHTMHSDMPPALNMLAEDDLPDTQHISTPQIFVTPPATIDTHKARAINFSSEEQHAENGLNVPNATDATGSSSHASSSGKDDLSDVSMDDDEDNMHKDDNSFTPGICIKGGLTYSDGEKIENGCETICTCSKGRMDCMDKCRAPFVRKGKGLDDPLCREKPTEDPCCSILECATDTETEPLEMCVHQNRTYQRGEKFNDGCSQVCVCDAAGRFNCKPRCRPISKTSDRCVEVPDPTDSCCKKVLCDVSLDDHEHHDKEQDIPKFKLMSAKFINISTILLKFDSKLDDSKSGQPQVELSADKMTWKTYKVLPGGFVEGAKLDVKFARLENTDDYVVIQNTDLILKQDAKKDINAKSCMHNGETHKLGAEFYDGCTSFCKCYDTGVKCLKIQCPTYFGLDVVDPSCIDWETVPADFQPTPPHCCPEKVQCKNNGSCVHKGVMYQNWQELPVNMTGCDKRCYCEMGKVECTSACPPVTAVPPATLPCPNHQASLSHLPDDDCCLTWICSTPDEPPPNFPGFPSVPGYQSSPDDINVQQVEAIDGQTVRLIFSVSPLIVGLHGRVEVRYTSKPDDNLGHWEVQVFAPPNDLIATQQLEFDLIGLQPNTEYRIKITIMLRDLHNTPSSRIYTVRTPAQVGAGGPLSTLPPMIPVEPNLVILELNSTWVTVAWRKLTEFELQFVDGVQLRFKEISGKVYAATPLIHRAVTSYTLENLKSNTEYEVGIFYIPFTGQTTELQADKKINFTTAAELDPYGFNVTLEILQIKPTTVEIAWSGVPYPEDKYVNIYRAIYQSDTGKGDFSTFKMAKRDSQSRTVIMDLKPGTRYRLWLEVYLTSGKIKTSNVQDFVTKPRGAVSLGAATQQGKLLSDVNSESAGHPGDYYGPLVVVAILAAIAILSTLVLLLILVRRHTQNKAAISSTNTRISQSAYDNPTYKVEIQQETMAK